MKRSPEADLWRAIRIGVVLCLGLAIAAGIMVVRSWLAGLDRLFVVVIFGLLFLVAAPLIYAVAGSLFDLVFPRIYEFLASRFSRDED